MPDGNECFPNLENGGPFSNSPTICMSCNWDDTQANCCQIQTNGYGSSNGAWYDTDSWGMGQYSWSDTDNSCFNDDECPECNSFCNQLCTDFVGGNCEYQRAVPHGGR